MNFKAISISLIPNFDKKEVFEAWSLLWNNKKAVGSSEALRQSLEEYFGKKVSLTENGRLAMYLLLKSFGVGKGDEVLVQAFTCSVVVSAIMALGAKPVYVDIDDEYNMDLLDLEKKITKKSRVVIVQHSFGMPVEMDKLLKIVKGKDIKVLEDLAHGLGNSYKGKLLGKWGDGAILSFGRDKVVSGLWGGGVVCSEEDYKRVEEEQKRWPERDRAWVKKELFYIVWVWLIVQSYGFLNLGKFLHWLSKKAALLSEPISKEEKKASLPLKFKGMRNELSYLVLGQFNKIEEIIRKRKEGAKFYAKELGKSYKEECSYLRYTIEVEGADELRKKTALKGVFLGDWYDQVVAPKSIKLEDFGYKIGSCPKAEEKSKRVINLATNPNMRKRDFVRVVEVVKNEIN